MKPISVLLIGCVVLMVAESKLLRESQVKRCEPYFQQYHECRDKRRELIRHQNDEAKRNLTKAVQLCFTESGCAAPAIPEQHAETPAEKECRKALRDARRVEVQKCVKLVYPDYVFAKPHPKRRKDHLLQRLLGLSVDQCPNKEAVVTCRKDSIDAYRKSRFQFKCASKHGCRVLMTRQCQELQPLINYVKCKCKTRVSDNPKIREGVAACQGVTPKPHKKRHFCPMKGYCKEGYEFWRNQHPLTSAAPKVSPAAPQPAPAPPAAPQQPAAPAPNAPQPAQLQVVPALPQQPAAPAAPQAPQPALPQQPAAPGPQAPQAPQPAVSQWAPQVVGPANRA